MENTDITDEKETGKNCEGEGDDNLLMNVEVDDVIKNITENRTIHSNVTLKQDYRRVLVPQNRLKPLKENWVTIVKALVEHMKIQVKMNTKKKCVEIRSSETTEDISAIQKSEDFLKAFVCGFDLQDSIAMLRLEDLYLETFEIKDGILLFISF